MRALRVIYVDHPFSSSLSVHQRIRGYYLHGRPNSINLFMLFGSPHPGFIRGQHNYAT